MLNSCSTCLWGPEEAVLCGNKFKQESLQSSWDFLPPRAQFPRNILTGLVVWQEGLSSGCVGLTNNGGSCSLAEFDIFLSPSGFKWLLSPRGTAYALDSEGTRLLGKPRRETAALSLSLSLSFCICRESCRWYFSTGLFCALRA